MVGMVLVLSFRTRGGNGFFFDSLNWPRVPSSYTFLRFLPPAKGLEDALSRWMVFPLFSTDKIKISKTLGAVGTYVTGRAWPSARPPTAEKS